MCLYFITSSIWGIVERLLLPKPKLDTSKLDSFDLDTELKQGVPKPGSNGASESLSNKQAVEERKKRDKERQQATQASPADRERRPHPVPVTAARSKPDL